MTQGLQRVGAAGAAVCGMLPPSLECTHMSSISLWRLRVELDKMSTVSLGFIGCLLVQDGAPAEPGTEYLVGQVRRDMFF